MSILNLVRVMVVIIIIIIIIIIINQHPRWHSGRVSDEDPKVPGSNTDQDKNSLQSK